MSLTRACSRSPDVLRHESVTIRPQGLQPRRDVQRCEIRLPDGAGGARRDAAVDALIEQLPRLVAVRVVTRVRLEDGDVLVRRVRHVPAVTPDFDGAEESAREDLRAQ